jgi:DnaD/phage-associated family protein
VKGFSGFPSGKLRATSLPSLFFSDLLPLIDDLAELKVTLYMFWALHRRGGSPLYVRRVDFLDDELLMSGLGATRRAAEDALVAGLERAVTRGTLLKASAKTKSGVEELYFLNTDRGRAAAETVARDGWQPPDTDEPPLHLAIERPNVFVLYEQNIGMLTPLIADELRDAELTYPAGWIEEAIAIAVKSNARKWRYIVSILERWRSEGRDDGKARGDSAKDRYRYIEGELGEFVDH